MKSIYIFVETKHKNMNTQNNIIDSATIGKYVFTIEKRENLFQYANYPFRVVFEQLTPKSKWHKSKVLKSIVFKTVDECQEWICEKYMNIKRNIEADKKRKEEKRQAQAALKASDHFEIGSIIYNSWGYEQTNVSFYQVVKMTAKRIIVKEIGQQMIEDSVYEHGMAHMTKAVKDAFLTDAKEMTLTVRPNGYLSTPKSEYGCFSKWDGTPKYVSYYY